MISLAGTLEPALLEDSLLSLTIAIAQFYTVVKENLALHHRPVAYRVFI